MLDLAGTYRLSGYVVIRPVESGFLLECITSGWQCVIKSPTVFQLLLAFTRSMRPADLIAEVTESQRAMVQAFIEQCYMAGLLREVGPDGSIDEDRGSLAHWEFHDLLFHTSSRLGRTRTSVGATYRLQGTLPNEPHLSSTSDEKPLLTLPSPEIERLKRHDVSLTTALESRRSLYGSKPLTLEELGEFLYRTCRVTSVTGDDRDEYVRKVYPSGGSMHPLEIYVVVSACSGLERGLYHYRALDHAFATVRKFDADVERLLTDAKQNIGGLLDNIPLLFVISARFRRMAWKYQSIAYHLILMEVGALYQTMYLVATAMGLSPCALGSGDSDHFARIIGVDYYMETSVGEFILAAD